MSRTSIRNTRVTVVPHCYTEKIWFSTSVLSRISRCLWREAIVKEEKNSNASAKLYEKYFSYGFADALANASAKLSYDFADALASASAKLYEKYFLTASIAHAVLGITL